MLWVRLILILCLFVSLQRLKRHISSIGSNSQHTHKELFPIWIQQKGVSEFWILCCLGSEIYMVLLSMCLCGKSNTLHNITRNQNWDQCDIENFLICKQSCSMSPMGISFYCDCSVFKAWLLPKQPRQLAKITFYFISPCHSFGSNTLSAQFTLNELQFFWNTGLFSKWKTTRKDS